jgi:MtN3 and saliva related transmembrane protein
MEVITLFFALCQFIGGIVLTFGMIPQIIQIIKTKSVNDLNFKTYATVLFGVILMEVYAVSLLISGVGTPFFVTNTLSLIIQLIVVLLILKYRRK